MPVEDLRQRPMMSRMLDALDRGEVIGHYGRLTFPMVAHHFLSSDELVEWLAKDGVTEENEASALVQQTGEKGCNPPRRAHTEVAFSAGVPRVTTRCRLSRSWAALTW
jgi:hypothetical protein